MTLKQRTFPSGLKSAELGFGCMSLFGGFMPAGPASKFPDDKAVLAHALDGGVTLFNTAAFYGGGSNEEGIAEVIKGRPRDSYQIATKWGPVWKDGQIQRDLSRKGCRAALEGSLARMGVDYIDLWVLRGPLQDPTPIEETFAEVKALVDEGKVKYVGLSEIAPKDIRKIHAIVPVTALELEWSLFARDCEKDLVPVARELGIGFLAYSPLGRGMLTGAIEKPSDIPQDDPRRHFSPRFSEENLIKNIELAKGIRKLAEKKGCTAGQLALAWVLAQGDDVVPIPGTKRIKYLDENLGAAAIKLSQQDLEDIHAAIPADSVSGDRYMNMKETSYHHGLEDK